MKGNDVTPKIICFINFGDGEGDTTVNKNEGWVLNTLFNPKECNYDSIGLRETFCSDWMRAFQNGGGSTVLLVREKKEMKLENSDCRNICDTFWNVLKYRYIILLLKYFWTFQSI